MKTPLAWLNLLHQRTRSSVAVAGVAFAVVLVLLQLGFLASVRQTATRIYDHLDFDLLLLSPEYLHFSKAGTIDRVRLTQAAAFPGVATIRALDVGFQLWRNVETGQRRGILMMAFEPHECPWTLPEVRKQQNRLERADAVFVDRLSRWEFGPKEVGVSTEVGRRTVQVVGEFMMGTGFSADGALLTSDATFRRLLPLRSRRDVSLGLIRLAPGENVDRAAGACAMRCHGTCKS